ncbi:MAG: hypothetical protein HC846_05605 [Blastocatellia bacterium]|nr:hypothetical protein [Blastocatellia bacterium]
MTEESHGKKKIGKNESSTKFTVTEIATNKPARKGSFYLTWNEYKGKQPRVVFQFKD